ncbi:MAG: metallophosphoesterase family protein [Clostridia bacterium]|nr:metallophosphoesterase family protein [Clostridia bacterium]
MAQMPSRTKRLIHSLMAFDRPYSTLQTEPVVIPCAGLPDAFHLARIAVVADLHLPDALLSLPRLLRCVAMQKPDAIFLPGDLTNSYAAFDEAGLRRLAKGLAAIAPCFAIPGNHELRLDREPLYREILTACGVHYMSDSYADWHKDGATLRLYGMARHRPAPLAVSGQPAIALAHKPEHFPYYRHARWNVVVCGHAHGGQVRMAGRSLYAPGQGFLPKYTAGIYTEGTTTMIVSRGLGNSSLPWRMGNQPHLPVIVLVRK